MNRTAKAAALVSLCVGGSSAFAQDFRIERVASNLNQPTFVTQAPGDPANVIYFSERTLNAVSGFGATNSMGRIYRYDMTTRTKTEVLNLSTRGVTNDDGLQTFAFSPDFNVVGSAGYQKMYVSSAERGTNAINRVEEYTVAGGAATFSKTILQYNNSSTGQNHTVGWVGFDPTAVGAARNYLYITTGDGNAGQTSRPSQNPNDVQGKVLRVDVAGADAYPTNALKNFGIPASNPLPAYNTAHPTATIAGLGEAYITGLRNVSRASFDRATGDMFLGDVGETTTEELDFIKAGSNATGAAPLDFGWPAREGTGTGWTSPYGTVNAATGVTSTNPIQQFGHTANGEAIIGGYKYNGPITSLKGKYIYADFVSGKLLALDYDRETLASAYNGANGTVTDVTTAWNNLVVDPTNANYTAALAGELFGIDHISSFGEDNAGNLYIVDFGYGSGFNGQYPGAGLGEIFRVTLVPEPTSLAMLAPLAFGLLRRNRRH